MWFRRRIDTSQVAPDPRWRRFTDGFGPSVLRPSANAFIQDTLLWPVRVPPHGHYQFFKPVPPVEQLTLSETHFVAVL